MENHMNIDYFQQRFDAAALPLVDQNDRFSQTEAEPLFSGEFEQFRSIAVNGLRSEQSNFIDVLSRQDNSPYDELYHHFDHLETEIATAQEGLALNNEQMERLQQVAAHAIALSPLAADQIAELLAAKREDIQTLTKAQAAQRVGGLLIELEKAQSVYDIAAQPWPLPLIPRAAVVHEDSIITIDTLPVEPETHVLAGSIEKKLREMHGHLTGASLKMFAFLLGNIDTPSTTNEIADYVYSEDEYFQSLDGDKRKNTASVRVSSLLSRNRMTDIMKSTLAEQGYKLQYGKRRFIDSTTGKQAQHSINLYQLTDRDAPDHTPTQVIMVESSSEQTITVSSEIITAQVENEKTKQQIANINSAIRLLDEKKILPEFDKEVSAARLQIASLRLSTSKSDSDNAKLKKLSRGLAGFSKGAKVNSADAILLILGTTTKHKKQYDHAVALIGEQLEKHYFPKK